MKISVFTEQNCKAQTKHERWELSFIFCRRPRKKKKKKKSCDFSKTIATHAWQWAKRNVGFRSCKGYSRCSLLIIEWRQAGNVQDVARCPDTLICRLHFCCVGCCELMRLMSHCEEMLVVTHYIDRVRSSIRKPPTSRLITFSIPLQTINPMGSTYGIYPTVSKIIHDSP